MNTKNYSFATQCIHGGQKPEELTGAIMPPIYQSSTFAQESPTKHKGYEYGRSHNPTRTALENNLKALEYATHALSFSSGCAATTAVLLSLPPNSHVIAIDDLYGGTRRLFEKVFSKFNIEFTFIDFVEKRLEDTIKDNTKLLWLETPTNPLLKIADIKKLSKVAKAHNIRCVVDNTFATPALQNPLLLGADLVLHSTTKYIAGHSDVIGGAIMTNDENWANELAFISNSIGAIPAPLDCFLTLRGIKTLDVRMKHHCKNSSALVSKLITHKNIEKVYFPFLENHPYFNIAKNQMKGPSGIISIVVKGGESKAIKVCERTKLFTCAESLGGVESLIEHPSSMTHASIDKKTRKNIGIDDALLRLSVGIEDEHDLWDDICRALN